MLDGQKNSRHFKAIAMAFAAIAVVLSSFYAPAASCEAAQGAFDDSNVQTQVENKTSSASISIEMPDSVSYEYTSTIKPYDVLVVSDIDISSLFGRAPPSDHLSK